MHVARRPHNQWTRDDCLVFNGVNARNYRNFGFLPLLEFSSITENVPCMEIEHTIPIAIIRQQDSIANRRFVVNVWISLQLFCTAPEFAWRRIGQNFSKRNDRSEL